MKKHELPKDESRTRGRVLARVMAEDLRQVNGDAFYQKLSDDSPGPTISEAATSESIPDHR